MKARNHSHKSRYEIFTKVLEELRSAEAQMRSIDLRTCPPVLRDDHRLARHQVDEAIKHVKAVCEGELDILDGRSE
jgi:hypothetical protein